MPPKHYFHRTLHLPIIQFQVLFAVRFRENRLNFPGVEKSVADSTALMKAGDTLGMLNTCLDGGFKSFLFISTFGEMIHFD